MITLTVNGTQHEVDAEPDTPLLYVLRDDLALNGAKFGCGLGQCGACTVMRRRPGGVLLPHADRACSPGRAGHAPSRASAPRGAGLAAARLHRRAGGAVRLLHRRHGDAGAGAAGAQPDPSEQQIRDAMAPNLCRCGTHMRILRGGAARRGGDAAAACHAVTAATVAPRACSPPAAALLVSFALSRRRRGAQGGSPPPRRRCCRAASKETPLLDAWIRVDAGRARSPCSPARPSSARA